MIRVIGADLVAAELVESALNAADVATETAAAAANDIADQWRDDIPTGPGGYQGAGYTGSRGANRTQVVDEPGRHGYEVANHSFVATFLQFGTPTAGPRVDLLGTADARAEQWPQQLAARLLP